MEVSLVIPTYNSADFIESNLSHILEKCPDYIREVLVVDDGSRDDTFKCVKKIADRSDKVRILRLDKNYGQSFATAAGIKNARQPWSITFDDDLQYSIDELDKLYEYGLELGDFQVIFGYIRKKKHRKSYNWFTRIAMFLLRTIFIPNLKRIKGISSIALINRKGFEEDDFHPIYVWNLNPEGIFNVEVNHTPAQCRTSNYTFGKYLVHFLPLLLFVFTRILASIAALSMIICLLARNWLCAFIAFLLILAVFMLSKMVLRKVKDKALGIDEYP